MKKKLKHAVAYDAIIDAKDNMKEAKYKPKEFLMALGFMGIGAILFLFVFLDNIVLHIGVKLLGIYLGLNGVGFLFSSYYFDEKFQDHADKKLEK